MMYALQQGSIGMNPWLLFGFGGLGIVFIVVLALALIALKGYSLWYAARRSEKWWFIALLLINTVGVLELIYLVFVVKKWQKVGNA